MPQYLDTRPVLALMRRQAEKGVLAAIIKGKTWLVTATEADRYEREHKGRRGRKPGAKSAVKNA